MLASFVCCLATTSPRRCKTFDNKFYNIGDVWKPSPNTQCSCAPGLQIRCSLSLVCRDHQQQTRSPGEEWLENSMTKCSCDQNNFVLCSKLMEPACMDSSGKIRRHEEMWMKSACLQCQCVNGSVNCTRYDVNVTYGLYEVKTYPTCERCFFHTTPELSAACAGKQNK